MKIPIDCQKIVTLTGVRRSGKTYHLFELMERIRASGVPNTRLMYFNFEDERLLFSLDEPDLILQAYQELYPAQDLSECYFFFDEIQELPGWEKFINRIYSSITRNIFITGSNANLLSKEIATSLRGRSVTYEIYPLSFLEFARVLLPHADSYQSRDRALLINLFDRFMRQGGFPELVQMAEDIKSRVLQEYFNVMLFRDLVERYQISNSATLKYFCKRVIGSSACEFSVNKIFNEVKSQGYKVSKDTLYAYQGYVESVYLSCFVNKYSPSTIKAETSLKKCYAIDQGLGAALDFKLAQDTGRLLETTVALELIKQGKRIAYLHNGNECDFVLAENSGISAAIQVSADLADTNTREREIKGLVQACKKHSLGEGLIITLDHSEQLMVDGIKITIFPAWQYFLE